MTSSVQFVVSYLLYSTMFGESSFLYYAVELKIADNIFQMHSFVEYIIHYSTSIRSNNMFNIPRLQQAFLHAAVS